LLRSFWAPRIWGKLAAVLRHSLGIDLQKAPDIGANCADSQSNYTLICEINYWN
ncbi:MAG: hypothetical protein RJA40_1099, partial [Actinomycetota bacterium]